MNIQVGDTFGQRYNAYAVKISELQLYANNTFKRLPRKLKKRLKNIEVGQIARVIRVVKTTSGSHTITLKGI